MMGLKNIRLVYLILLIIGLKSCNSVEWTYSKLLTIKPTHAIIYEKINDELNILLKDDVNYGEFNNEIIIMILQKNEINYQICLSRTDYNNFTNYRPDNFDEFKGYLIYKERPVLLFGAIDETFFNKSGEMFHNVLGDMPVYDIDNPPIIYEPRMMCFVASGGNGSD